MKTNTFLFAVFNLFSFLEFSAVTPEQIALKYKILCGQIFMLYEKVQIQNNGKLNVQDPQTFTQLVDFLYGKIKDDYQAVPQADLRAIIKFLISLSPGQNLLKKEDHHLFCQCINELVPLFYHDATDQDQNFEIKLSFLQAAFDFFWFKKNCQEHQNESTMGTNPRVKDLLNTKRKKNIVAATFRLIKHIREFVVKYQTHPKIFEQLKYIGKSLKAGFVVVFGDHVDATQIFHFFQEILSTIGHHPTLIADALGVFKVLCFVIPFL